MELVAVVAISENNIIGNEGELPWPSVPADKRQYRRRVADAPVLMGRRTFESMREDLPGSRQIVLSRDPDRTFDEASVTVVESVDEAIDELHRQSAERGYVLGGGGIYKAFFPQLDRLVISRIPGEYEGSVTFPQIDPDDWECLEQRSMEGFDLEIWERH